jgi:hypothetical protein
MAQALDLPVVAIDADMDGSATETETAVATAGLSDVLIDTSTGAACSHRARDDRVELLAAADHHGRVLAPAIAARTDRHRNEDRYRC